MSENECASMLEWAAQVRLAAEAECKQGRPDTPFELAAWQINDVFADLMARAEELAKMQREFGASVRDRTKDKDLLPSVPHVWMRKGDSVHVYEGAPVVIVPVCDRLSVLSKADPEFGEQHARDVVSGLASERKRGQ